MNRLFIDPEVDPVAEDYPLSARAHQALWEMESRHFWHRARGQWIVDALMAHGALPPARVLEVGCGSGVVLGRLAAEGYLVTGVDTVEALVRKAHERVPQADLACCDVAQLPSQFAGPFDVVGLFDVIEHLNRPATLLDAARVHARPGALVAISVPAGASIYSAVDVVSGHKRRYERGEVAALMRGCGIEPLAEYGIFRATAWLRRWVARTHTGDLGQETALSARRAEAILMRHLRVPARPLNNLLGWICRWEQSRGLARAVDRDGASLLVLGRVPESSREQQVSS